MKNKLAKLIPWIALLMIEGAFAAWPTTLDQEMKAMGRAQERAKRTGQPFKVEDQDYIDPVAPSMVPEVNPYTGHEINPKTGLDTSKKVSEPTLTLLPKDPVAAKLKFSDKTIDYKKVFYLKGVHLGEQWWIDENRYVTNSYPPDYNERDNLPKIVIVDVRTGAIEDTGNEGKIDCFSEGRIATSITNRRPFRSSDGKVHNNIPRYFGKLGEPLEEYLPLSEQGSSDLNIPSCQLVPHWPYPKPQQGEPYLKQRIPLKVEHGAIMVWEPKNYPQLRLGQDPNNYNRLTFNRTGSAVMLPLQAYWEQPSGKRIDIPLNPGEEISVVYWIPYENAYFISLHLTNTQPIKSWYSRFARLLYLDGTIKRFGVPKVIMELVQQNKIVASPIYTKLGVGWSVNLLSGHSDLDRLNGDFLIVGDELVKRPRMAGRTNLDGCKEYRSEEALFSKKRNYFYIDICKGE